MSIPCIRPLAGSLLAVIATLLPAVGRAQFTQRPSLGIQSIIFDGATPQSAEISPGNDRSLSLGGGLRSSNNAPRLQLELIPDADGIIRIPLSVEYYLFVGKTTFAASGSTDPRRVRWLFRHSAQMLSLGAGLTAAFFQTPNLYFSIEGKYNVFFPNEVENRRYYVDNGDVQSTNSYHPYAETQTRIGAYFRVGTQVDFFDPFMLDFSLGYGILNLLGRSSDPATERNLLVAEPRNEPETTTGYFGIGMSVIWQL